mgnify:CR=1 FL=1
MDEGAAGVWALCGGARGRGADGGGADWEVYGADEWDIPGADEAWPEAEEGQEVTRLWRWLLGDLDWLLAYARQRVAR